MQFLKALFHWFLHGTAVSAENAPLPVVETRREKKEKNEKPAPVDVVETILSEAKPESFLDELRSIQPSGKQFDKDRADLIQEVKRLSGRKHT